MTAKSYLRGHEIEYRDGQWVYSDTKEPTAQERPCSQCGEPSTPEGHDACLGTLPGVMNACCGHGRVDEAYVQYPDGSSVRGEEAIRAIESLKPTSRR